MYLLFYFRIPLDSRIDNYLSNFARLLLETLDIRHQDYPQQDFFHNKVHHHTKDNDDIVYHGTRSR